MSSELVVIPRGELRRALGIATYHARTAFVLAAFGVAGVVSAFVIPFGVVSICGGIGGVLTLAIAGVALVRAKRARSTIETKLRAQELPSARLLER